MEDCSDLVGEVPKSQLPVKKRLGRPPMPMLEEVTDRICQRIADGESLRSICSDKDMPDKSTVLKWLSQSPAFASQYAHARELQADAIFDEVLDIADDGRNDWMEANGKDDEGWKQNGEAIQRSKLRIDARKWMAGKLRPKKYGEKTLIGSDPDNPLPEGNKIDVLVLAAQLRKQKALGEE